MEMKTSELIGAALDWAVAKCEEKFFAEAGEKFKPAYSPSTNWSQGGPIIERELILTMCPSTGDFWDARKAGLSSALEKRYFRGPTPLIAAMRCYVASKLGDNVDIPNNLF